MNIAQVSSLSGRGQGLLEVMIQEAPLLQTAEFKLEGSSHLVVTGRSKTTDSAARKEGDPGAKNTPTPNTTARNLALYTRNVYIDDVRRNDVAAGLQSVEGLRSFGDTQLRVEAKGLASELANEIINGIDANDVGGVYHMLGINQFVKDAAAAGQTARFGFTAAQIAALNKEVTLQLNTAANQDAFVELLEQEIVNVPGANALIMSGPLFARLGTIARRLGAAGETRNSFGVSVKTFANVPMIPVAGLAMDETYDAVVNAGSIFIVRFAEDTGVQIDTNSGIAFKDFDEVESIPAGMSRIQSFVNLSIRELNSIRRLSRITL